MPVDAPSASARGGVVLPAVTHREHEVAWAVTGYLRIRIDGRSHHVAGDAALWVPAGRSHVVELGPDTLAAPVWLDPEVCPELWSEATPLRPSPELRTSLTRCSQHVLSRVAPPAELLERTVALLRTAAGDAPPPMPRHPAARRVAASLLTDPADPRTLAMWSGELFVGERTLQRAFRTETGRSFRQWRTDARLHAAQPLLTDGRAVGEVARAVGYTSVGGFITAYRRRFGHTPTGRGAS